MLNISSLELLVHELSRLPGIGPKTAQRLAYFILRAPKEYSQHLRFALTQVEEKVHFCPQCFSYTDEEICRICTDHHRNTDLLCVVEEPSDILGMESSGVFRGRYHVLHGAIAPLDGVGPDDLKIKELVSRIALSHETGHPIKEVILALDADLEGDTTVLYLTRLLTDKNVKVTRIAQGVPIGSDLDYLDHRTLGRALENRVEL
jgi:recombination protein RecR